MSKFIIKCILFATCLTIVAVPGAAQKGKGGGGGSSCAVVATPLLSTSSASPGMSVGVFSRVGNCSTGKKRFTVTMSATSACGEETVISSGVISFEAGQYKLVSSSYVISPDTCLGASTVAVTVYDRGTMLVRDTTSLMLQ